MARDELRPVAGLRRTAGTGRTDGTRENRRNHPDRPHTYDPVLRAHVTFRAERRPGPRGPERTHHPMKPGIHPVYGPVVFRDKAAGSAFLTRSTLAGAQAAGERTVEWEDGRTYPVIDVEISSAGHPFYTGTARVLDTAGRVERFRRRYGTGRSR